MMHWKSVLVLVVVAVGLCTGAPSKENSALREKRFIQNIDTTEWWIRTTEHFAELAENYTRIQENWMNMTAVGEGPRMMMSARLQQLIDRWQRCAENPFLCFPLHRQRFQSRVESIGSWFRGAWGSVFGGEAETTTPEPMEETTEMDDSIITDIGFDVGDLGDLGDLGIDLTHIDPYGILPDDSASEE